MADGEQVLSTAVTATAQIATEAMKLLATAIGKVLEEYLIRRNSAEYRRQDALFKNDNLKAKKEADARKLQEWSTSKSGYLSPRQMIEARRLGVEMYAIPIQISKEDLKELTKLAAKEGVLFGALERRDYNGKNPIYYLSFRATDLPKVNDILNILKFERKLKNIDIELAKKEKENTALSSELSELKEYVQLSEAVKFDGLSDYDKGQMLSRMSVIEQKYDIKQFDVEMAENKIADISSTIYSNEEAIKILESEKGKLILERKQAQNNLSAETVLEETFKSEKEKGGNEKNTKGSVSLEKFGEHTDFESAMNRITDRELQGEQTVYICDIKNPEHYIEAVSANAMFEGKNYIRTQYTVFDGAKPVMTTDDGRYAGKTVKDWFKIRNSMKKSLDFSDSVIKFSSKEELLAYQSRCKQAKEVTAQEKGSAATIVKDENGAVGYRDYNIVISNLKKSCEERGYTITGGESQVAVHQQSGKSAREVFEQSDGLAQNDRDDRENAAVCYNLQEQVNNYMALWAVEDRMVNVELALLTYSEGTTEHEQAIAEMESLKEERANLLEKERELSEQRTSIENAMAISEVDVSEQEHTTQREEVDTDLSIEKQVEQEILKLLEREEVDADLSLEKAVDGDKSPMSIDDVARVYGEKAAALKATGGVSIEKETPVHGGRG